MFGAFALTTIIFLCLAAFFQSYTSFPALLFAHWNLILAAGIMFVLGLYDDFKRISPPAKLIVQLIAATIFIFYDDDVIRFFPWPVANLVLTFFWLVGISNAINLLDNMDGLAGGVSLIAALFLCYFNWRVGDGGLLFISLALAGGILGFLIYNFPPARIFMGDSGSMFLGFTLAALAVARKTQASSVFAVMGVPIMLFLLPILDTSLVTVTRILRGQSPAQGGTDHTSHRLVAFGLSERQAVLVLYGMALVSGISAVVLEARDYSDSLVLTPLVLIILSLFTAYLARLKVVTAAAAQETGLARLMVSLTYKRRIFELLFDLLLISFSYYLAYWMRYGLNMTSFSMGLFLSSWPAALGSSYLSFYVMGIYRGVWRYVGIDDLLRYARAAIAATLLTLSVSLLFNPNAGYPLEVFVMFGVALFLGLGATRLSFQVLDGLYQRQQIRPGASRILLVGAGDAGELTLNWIARTPDLHYKPLGFLDDDPKRWGAAIHDVAVLGGLEILEKVCVERKVDGILLTTPPDAELMGRLLPFCRQKGIWVRVLRLELELIE